MHKFNEDLEKAVAGASTGLYSGGSLKSRLNEAAPRQAQSCAPSGAGKSQRASADRAARRLASRTRRPGCHDSARAARVARSGAKRRSSLVTTYMACPCGFATALIYCLPSPCARFSRARTTTEAPPLGRDIARHGSLPGSRGQALGSRFPRSLEKAADAALSIDIRVDSLELHVQEARAHERVQCALVVEILLEGAQHLAERVRWRREVHRVPRAAAVDPVPSNAGVIASRGSVGGRANGMKAATSSPPTVVRSYRPVVRFGIRRAPQGKLV